MSTQKPAGKTKRVTIRTLAAMKEQGEKISMLTAYDYTMAGIVDQAGIDVMLVGDSAANVMAGYDTTVPMTMDQMVYHASCVVRGTKRALVVADLPFMSYQTSVSEALANAGRMMKEAGVQGVKVEGGRPVAGTVEKIVDAGIPVMAHLGLTPQSVHQFGGYSVQATGKEEAERLIEDAQRLEQAGCFALVLEKIPAGLAREVTEALTIPTIGIGAGAACSGQVLVVHDMLGMNKEFKPRFLRRYADLQTVMTEAVQHYIADVKEGSFPNEDEQYQG